MGLAQFKADVVDAKKCRLPGVVNVRRGDSDGEFSLTCTHERFCRPVEIQILAPGEPYLDFSGLAATDQEADVTLYPKTSHFMAFTISEDVEEAAVDFVERIPPWTRGKSVQQILTAISDKLSTLDANEPTTDSEQGDTSSNELDHSDDTSEAEESDSADYCADESMFDPLPPVVRGAPGQASMSPASVRRLKKDLKIARAAGVCVGLLPGVKNQVCDFISLSIRISKLGIPADSLEAWGLKASDYAVLLLKFPGVYPTVSDFVHASASLPVVRFRFGKCDTSKPSLESASQAFADRPNRPSDEHVGSRNSAYREACFAPLHVSKSINALLNEQMANLLSIRRNRGVGWESAQVCLDQIIQAGHVTGQQADVLDSSRHEGLEDGPIITDAATQYLCKDYVKVDDEQLSLPLVAMQFALRRLARCTQYCMNCHRKIQGGFESVKPELCYRELCQYQYLSLGLGVSIEHEIIHNPFVVDLLVSFFYASVRNKAIRAVPGLSLRNNQAGFVPSWNTYAKAEAFFSRNTMSVKPKAAGCLLNVNEGDQVLVIQRNFLNVTASPAGEPIEIRRLPKLVCRVMTVHDDECTVKVLPQETVVNSRCGECYGMDDEYDLPPADGSEVYLYQYDQDLDALEFNQRADIFMAMAKGIRSVLDMREYLVGSLGRPLSSWPNMHRSSLALLNWIVASNRSFIVQDDAVPSTVETMTENPNRVEGMDQKWMQFRFAQGSREKEQLFSKALESELPQGADFPTIFAWHGSPLGNWHSIIRTGLDFNDTAHGRAFGHGVYFSPMFSTSRGYLTSAGGINWPNSHLNVSDAISLCEIINKPASFVSSNPHYVVDKLNWIQCRYLFVRVEPTTIAVGQPFSKRNGTHASGYVVQEKGREVWGQTEPLKIPVSGLPAGRRAAATVAMSAHSKGSRTNPFTEEDLNQDKGSDGVEVDDIDLLPDLNEGLGGTTTSGKRQRSQSDDSIGMPTPYKLNVPRSQYDTPRDEPMSPSQSLTHPVTAFYPGSLDLSSLPSLPEPTWAASSRVALQRLSRDVKDLQKVQTTTPPAILGWYIDFDKLRNVFHWTVELHSFDTTTALGQDMIKNHCTSVVLELRFGSSYPMSPPFVRVIRPRFVPFMQGGGGHVTAGGAVCSELLTNSGWSPALSLEKVFLEVRLNLMEVDPPARLEKHGAGDYGVADAVAAYRRAAAAHGWQIPEDLNEIVALGMG